MKGYSSREIIEMINAAGWYYIRTVGDHHHFKHPTRPGIVTVPHPKKDLPKGTLKSIARQAGIELP